MFQLPMPILDCYPFAPQEHSCGLCCLGIQGKEYKTHHHDSKHQWRNHLFLYLYKLFSEPEILSMPHPMSILCAGVGTRKGYITASQSRVSRVYPRGKRGRKKIIKKENRTSSRLAPRRRNIQKRVENQQTAVTSLVNIHRKEKKQRKLKSLTHKHCYKGNSPMKQLFRRNLSRRLKRKAELSLEKKTANDLNLQLS